MAFQKKEWLKRIVQFPGRRKLTPSGIDNVYNVERAEGEVLQAGDGFTKENMDDLEERISSGFKDMEPFYGAYSSFPIPGDPNRTYIDNTVDPRLMYTYDPETSTYIPTGGSGGQEQVFFGSYADFPAEGNSDVLYVDTSNTAVLLMYRWNGSAYVPSGGGSADLDVVAQEFDDTKAYTKGEYVIYSGGLYCFASDKAAGEWDSTIVTPTTVGVELNALNAKMPIILWENPDPTVAFGPQNIILNSSDYNYYEIICSFNPDASATLSTKSIKGRGCVLQRAAVNTAGTATIAYRLIKYISDTELAFDNSLNNSSSGKPNVANNTLVPIRIIGYKS